MREILSVIYLIVKIVSAILFVWEDVCAFKAKAQGNYLEALYCPGWAIILFETTLNL